MNHEKRMLTRRDFLKLAGVTGAALALLPLLPSASDNGDKKADVFGSEEDRLKAIQATATAVEHEGWQKLEDEGFPETAVNTAVSIQAFEGPDESWSGSGTVMFIKDIGGQSYWVVLTAGHLFLEGSHQELQRINLGRKLLPHAGQESFTSSEFGVAAAYEDKLYKNTSDQAKGLDVGVIVLPDAVIENRLDNLVERNRALTMDQIKFGGIIDSGSFSAIGFPGITNLEPTVIQNGIIGLVESKNEPVFDYVLVSKALSAGGFSGGGIFWTPPTQGESLYVGPLNANFEPQSKFFAKSVRVTKIAKLGKWGLLRLIQDAIDGLKSKQNCLAGVCNLDDDCGPNSYCVNGSCIPKDQFDIGGH